MGQAEMAEQHQLTGSQEGISCHAWNSDRSMLAVSPNSNEIHIYGGCNTANWKKLFTLAEHDLLVSALDWSPVNNKIVSCSHDRNAFVWSFIPATAEEPAHWKPALVILRIDRAAIDVKWSLDGLRFAVTSGAKCVPVCTYESENDWWISKMIKKAKSTVLCCVFHPSNGQILATGSSDFKCRIFSTFCGEVDGAEDAGIFGAPVKFGETYGEYNALGWVNAVAWSPSGSALAFAGQDSSVHILTFSAGGAVSAQVVRYRDLPCCKLLFLSEAALVGCGHDFNPLLFSRNGQQFSFPMRLDVQEEVASPTAGASSGVAAARALFQNKSVRGQEKKQEFDVLWTQHENTITGLAAHTTTNKNTVTKFSTSSVDGRIVIWDLNALKSSVQGLDLGSLQI